MPNNERQLATDDAQSSAVTQLLRAAADGDEQAPDRLLELVYAHLRAIAQQRMSGERRGHTLQATALVHEAYLRLVGDRQIPWANQAHFYVAAAEAIRRVLLDHARAKGRVKRGGGQKPVALTSIGELAAADGEEILRFDDALQRLEEESSEAAAVVRLRFFSGLSVDQTAAALGLSSATVDRRWAFARAWLYSELNPEE
jgi:RNA polymerase sigma factor (TIGR02999 family)